MSNYSINLVNNSSSTYFSTTQQYIDYLDSLLRDIIENTLSTHNLYISILPEGFSNHVHLVTDEGVPFQINYMNFFNKYNIYSKFNNNNVREQGFRDKCIEWFFKNPYLWNGNNLEKILQFKNKYLEKYSLTNSDIELDLVSYKNNANTNVNSIDW